MNVSVSIQVNAPQKPMKIDISVSPILYPFGELQHAPYWCAFATSANRDITVLDVFSVAWRSVRDWIRVGPAWTYSPLSTSALQNNRRFPAVFQAKPKFGDGFPILVEEATFPQLALERLHFDGKKWFQFNSGHVPSSLEGVPNKVDANESNDSEPHSYNEHSERPFGHILLGVQIVVGLFSVAIGAYGIRETGKPSHHAAFSHDGKTGIWAFLSCGCLVFGCAYTLVSVAFLIG